MYPIENNDWAAPIVPIIKKNGKIRLRGGYRLSVNPHLKVDKYSVPRIQDLLAKLGKGKIFTKLDVTFAYT